jgi:hypothetical protein
VVIPDGQACCASGKQTAQREARLSSEYFAGQEFGPFNSSGRERQLQEALTMGDPMTDLSLALEVNYFRLARDRYFVPIAVKIPGSDIELARSGSTESTRLDFIGEVRDARGTIQDMVRDEINAKLKGSRLANSPSQTCITRQAFTLTPGAYTMKFLAERVDGNVQNKVHRAAPDCGLTRPADQLRRVQQPARETVRRGRERRKTKGCQYTATEFLGYSSGRLYPGP